MNLIQIFCWKLKKISFFLHGTDIEDFVSLMFSDFILGPPSTFSSLAKSISLKMKLKEKIGIELLKERDVKL